MDRYRDDSNNFSGVDVDCMKLYLIGGRSTVVHAGMTEPYMRKGDVIGCALDLSVPVMNFYLNGVKVKGNFKNMNMDGMFFPVVSCSARVRYCSKRKNICLSWLDCY